MQHTQQTYTTNFWQQTPSYMERFREGRSSFQAEAQQATHLFCGYCGFWVDGPHQCPPPSAAEETQKQAQRTPCRLTAFCQTCPDANEVARFLQSLGFHLDFSLPAEERSASIDLPPLPAQFHFEDEVGTRVEFLAGIDTSCLDDDEFSGPVVSRYPIHASRFWLTSGGQELAMRRTQEQLAQRWNLAWLDQGVIEPLDEVA